MTITETVFETAPVTVPTILTPQQKQAERLRALAGTYQTTDRILSGEGLTVVVEQNDNAPAAAWTDGSQITFNSARVKEIDASSVERMNGLNFHELSHVLYTPRRGTSLVSWVLDHQYTEEFNLLEDQRIEALLTARYPATVPWLSAAIARWVLDGKAAPTGYLFVRGRKYLDGRLRGALRATFIAPELLPRVDSVIDEYRTLAFSQDFDKAKPLITEFAEILRELRQSPDFPQNTESGDSMQDMTGAPDPNGHGCRPQDVLSGGRPKGVSEQRQAAQRVDDGEDEVTPTPQPDQPSDTDADGSGQGDQSYDDDDSDQGTGAGEGQPNGSSDDGDPTDGAGSSAGDSGAPNQTPSAGTGKADQTEGSQDAQSASGAGNNSGADQIVKAIAQQVLTEIRENPIVAEDIRQRQRQIATAGGADLLKKTQWEHISPLPEYANQSSGLRKALSRLLQKADPGWDSRTSNGRVNPMRWVQERDLDTAFDQWNEGVHDAVDMEVVILLDESGSMGPVMKEAATAMWIVKRALDRIGASTTVITFDDKSRVLYHRRDKATPMVRYSYHSGGTNPVLGLAQAASIFARTRRTQKILIIFTDGEWFASTGGDEVSSEEYIRRFNVNGVTTALGYIDRHAENDYRRSYVNSHGCTISSVVTGPGLVPFISSIVTTTIKRRLVSR